MGNNASNSAPDATKGAAAGSVPKAAPGGGRVIDPAKAKNKVRVAASVLGGAPPMQAFHTSIMINDEEFFFDMGGVESSSNLASHQQAKQAGQQTQFVDMGMTDKSASELLSTLRPFFTEGTYDLVKKNCNSFSDCALFFLLGKRLDNKFKTLERIGAANPGMLSMMTNGEYKENPKAKDFVVESVIAKIDPEKMWSTPGQATGGDVVSDKEAMRMKRLAALGQA
eukprot:GDKH01002333.1.p1 GENE.GDKH01002333.1~~GDKH01002333.1.p1  ORF type:complete len:225 (-),score=42.32 GDKH01002333.1:193-867(-)